MKRILFDQGLAPHAATLLRLQGFDSVHVSEIALQCEIALSDGAAVPADGKSIRVRRLPQPGGELPYRRDGKGAP